MPSIRRHIRSFDYSNIRTFLFPAHLRLAGGIGYNIWQFGRLVDMCMLDEIRVRRDEIYAIARRHKAEWLWVFGSCALEGMSA